MGRVSFAANPLSIVGWIYYPDHSLPPGMYVDVPHLDCLLVAALITLEGLDHVILKPKQLDGVVAVNVDEVLGHVAMALSKKSQAGKTSRNDLHRQKGLKLGPRLHGIYCGQGGIQCCLFKLVVDPWSQCLHQLSEDHVDQFIRQSVAERLAQPLSMSFQVGRGCLPLIITRQRLSDTRRHLPLQFGPSRWHESAWCLLDFP